MAEPESKAEEDPTKLWLFNSMTKEKEIFRPRVEGKVGMYVCGVTHYDFSHIGHARAYVAFDVLQVATPYPLGCGAPFGFVDVQLLGSSVTA